MEMQNINQQKWKVPKFHPGNIKKCEISNLNIQLIIKPAFKLGFHQQQMGIEPSKHGQKQWTRPGWLSSPSSSTC
jgi:hypothetical protein